MRVGFQALRVGGCSSDEHEVLITSALSSDYWVLHSSPSCPAIFIGYSTADIGNSSVRIRFIDRNGQPTFIRAFVGEMFDIERNGHQQ